LLWQQHGYTGDVTHIVLLNLVFFIPATCGASAFALIVQRALRHHSPPDSSPPGGSKVPLPTAGPDDLARSA
jgi:hypothetical protein